MSASIKSISLVEELLETTSARKAFQIAEEISKKYPDLKNPEISPEQSLTNLNRFKTLIISNPIEAFTQSEKYILDQSIRKVN